MNGYEAYRVLSEAIDWASIERYSPEYRKQKEDVENKEAAIQKMIEDNKRSNQERIAAMRQRLAEERRKKED